MFANSARFKPIWSKIACIGESQEVSEDSGISGKIAQVAIPEDKPKYRGNGNECNFSQIAHGIAKCSQGYLLLTPQMKAQK